LSNISAIGAFGAPIKQPSVAKPEEHKAFRVKDALMPIQKQNTEKESFFFATERPYGLATIRILLSLVCLSIMVHRWPYAREIFSTDGSAAPLADNYGYFEMLPVPSGSLAIILASILVFSLMTSCIGWCTRASLIISTILYTYLNLLDCMGSMTKYSAIATHALFILCLSHCGSVWSMDSMLRRKRMREGLLPAQPIHPTSEMWPRRLMQLMMGLVYLGAAFTKMHTPAFFSSDQMRSWFLTNVNHANPFGEWLSAYPGVLVASAYITILWEILFIFVVWRQNLRLFMIVMGIGFHVATYFTLGLIVFPLVCIPLYCAFFDERDYLQVVVFFKRLLQRTGRLALFVRSIPSKLTQALPDVSQARSGLIYAGLLLAVCFVGVEVEYQIDPFKTRGAEGPMKLVEMDPAKVKKMLKKSERIREHDKYLSFDIGSELIGDVLLDSRSEFTIGETLIAQCTLTPPHEDMWIECNLHDSDDVVIDHVGQVIDRNTLRSSYSFAMIDVLAAGDYFLVLQSRGIEITRRKFTLKPRSAE
jgi:hypothetical protein